MAERGLSFITSLVEAIQGGRKTITRRPKKGHKPLAAQGDIIWVRETYFLGHPGAWDAPHIINPESPSVAAWYRAGWVGPAPGSWRPSIYMPRWAARVFLDVTSVRREPLQEITADDVREEGIALSPDEDPIATFAALWDALYAEKGLGWERNPEVWRVAFRLTGRS